MFLFSVSLTATIFVCSKGEIAVLVLPRRAQLCRGEENAPKLHPFLFPEMKKDQGKKKNNNNNSRNFLEAFCVWYSLVLR